MRHFHQARTELLRQLQLPSPIQPLHLNWPGAKDVQLFVKRDDLIHPVISGNKWRKLSETLITLTTAPSAVVSFGGGFSNHLHALGYVCNQLNLPFTALVRGNYSQSVTPMIRDLHAWGGAIRYVSKVQYRERDTPAFIAQLQADYPGALIVPEGGSQQTALSGVRQIVTEQPNDFDIVICPVASGATLAGIASALSPGQRAIGIAVLKGQDYLESLVSNLFPNHAHRWHIEHGYTHGGYAKQPAELQTFCHEFSNHTGIAVEPVYSGKLLFAVKQMLNQGMFARGQRILLLHTGGLQGAR